MNHCSYYGMEYDPFIKNTEDVIIDTSESREVRYRLEYLKETKGFGLLTGQAGRGKTTTVRAWASTLNSSLYKVVYIPLSTITVQEFYRQLATGLGAEPAFRKVDNFRTIQDIVTRYALEKKITPVIILDEANYMSNGILNDLKLLFNFSMDSRDRAVVLLTGLPQLNNTLRLNVHEPLRQRIVMNYDIDGLNEEEAREYVLKKMEQASCRKKVFEESAMEAVINSGNGTMRIINRICENCLLLGYHEKKEIIDTDIVMKAVNDMELS